MKLVIFDLDGTLLNTLEDLAAAANEALRENRFPLRSIEEIQQFVGNGVSKLLERALPDGQKTSENLIRMKQDFFAYYDAHLWEHTVVYPGILELLETLQQQSIQLAVASNKYQQATDRLVTHFFPSIRFSAVFGQRPNVPVKPHPQIVQSILRVAAVSAEDALYVGDSAVDMQTAQNAGVKACGVTWGFRSREELADYHPELLADTPQRILTLFH